MATYSLTTGVDNFTGANGVDDVFIVEFDRYGWDSIPAGFTSSMMFGIPDEFGNYPKGGLTGPVNGTPTLAQINAGDKINGRGGNDALWAGGASMSMDPVYSKDFDFRPMTITSIEQLWFSYMMMPMPGSARFNSSQFGTGMSNNLSVRGAWGGTDIIVDLVSGARNFSAAGWTFQQGTPSSYLANLTVNGETYHNVPVGTSQYNWGAYYHGMYNAEVGLGMAGDDMGGDFYHQDRVIINGSSGADTIAGSIMYDVINAGAGNDRIKFGQGGDDVNGGSGTDTLIFTKARSNYTVTNNGGSVTITDTTGTTPTTFAYTDAYNSVNVTNVERFQFSNTTCTLAQLLQGASAPAAALSVFDPVAASPSVSLAAAGAQFSFA